MSGRPRPVHVLVVAVALLIALWTRPPPARGSAVEPSAGADLYATQCAGCHGTDGRGVADRGPDLSVEGRAAVDFAVRTGRMPLADPTAQARRGPVRFTGQQITDLVDYVGSLGSGPDIPEVDIGGADVGAGGVLYRLNCAACHVASGAGAAIGGGHSAPALMTATPTEIGEAILIGPGAMPIFDTFSPTDIDNVAAYLHDLQVRHSTGVRNLGGVGPVAEGLAAWVLGLLSLVALTRWMGRPSEGRDRGAVKS